MKDQIIEVSGTCWKIREAKSMEDAMNAISSARVSGSVGAKNVVDRTYVGGTIEVLADVVRLNSDGTECQPYNVVSNYWRECS